MTKVTTMKIIIALALLLSGCGQQLYSHPIHSDEQTFARDNYECEAGSTQMVGQQGVGWGFQAPIVNRGLFQRCMEGRGYVRVQ